MESEYIETHNNKNGKTRIEYLTKIEREKRILKQLIIVVSLKFPDEILFKNED